MKTMFEKIRSAVTTAALFAIGVVMAGIGFAAIGVLAIFALATIGIALLAAPFIRQQQTNHDDIEMSPAEQSA